MPTIRSVNVGASRPGPWKPGLRTGIGKQPTDGPVEVRAPGPRKGGLGSGLVGDFIGDSKFHGGDDQAVYAVGREDLDRWAERLGRPLPDGHFGENLTTHGHDVNESLIGEVWRVGDTVELQITLPRIPCATFGGWMGEKGWVKAYTLDNRPGTYLRVLTAGEIRAGDELSVVRRPEHGVTVSMTFRAMTRERDLAPSLLVARDDMTEQLLHELHLD